MVLGEALLVFPPPSEPVGLRRYGDLALVRRDPNAHKGLGYGDYLVICGFVPVFIGFVVQNYGISREELRSWQNRIGDLKRKAATGIYSSIRLQQQKTNLLLKQF